MRKTNSSTYIDVHGQLQAVPTQTANQQWEEDSNPTERGLKFDADKLRYDLIPAYWFERIADITTYGAKKYSANNWKLVENGIDRYYAAAIRHLIAYKSGEYIDEESGRTHLAHAAWNCLALITLTEFST